MAAGKQATCLLHASDVNPVAFVLIPSVLWSLLYQHTMCALLLMT